MSTLLTNFEDRTFSAKREWIRPEECQNIIYICIPIVFYSFRSTRSSLALPRLGVRRWRNSNQRDKKRPLLARRPPPDDHHQPSAPTRQWEPPAAVVDPRPHAHAEPTPTRPPERASTKRRARSCFGFEEPSAMEAILDFSKPLDVALLDEVYKQFNMEGNPQVSTPATRPRALPAAQPAASSRASRANSNRPAPKSRHANRRAEDGQAHGRRIDWEGATSHRAHVAGRSIGSPLALISFPR